MSNMLQFHQRLTRPAETFDPYWQGLINLKQADREAVLVLSSEYEWFTWSAAEAAPQP